MEVETPQFEASPGFKFGAAVGALVLTCAGGAWSLTGLISRPGTPNWLLLLAIIPTLAIAALSIRRLASIRRLRQVGLPDPRSDEWASNGRRMGIQFGIIFTIEGLVIALAAMSLARMARPLLIPIAVIGIVGLHFVPLASVFRIRTYAALGFALVGLAAASLLIRDEPTRVLALSLSSAVVLWLAATRVLLLHAAA